MKIKFSLTFSFLLILHLGAEEEVLEEIVTVGSIISETKIESTSTIDVIDKEDIKRLASNDLKSLLSNYLGIDGSSNGGLGQYSSVFLRGSNSNHALVKVNGIRINPQTAGGAALQNIDPSLVSKIEVGSGQFSSIHGSEAIGGVINISTSSDIQKPSTKFTVSGGTDSYKKQIIQKNWNDSLSSFNLFLLNSSYKGFPTLVNSSTDRGYTNKSYGGSYKSNGEHSKINFFSWNSEGRTEYLNYDLSPVSQEYKTSTQSLSYIPEIEAPFALNFLLGISKDLIEQNELNYLSLKDLTQTKENNFQVIFSNLSYRNIKYFFGYEYLKQKVDYSSFGSAFEKNLITKSIFSENKITKDNRLISVNLRFAKHEVYGSQESWNLGYRKEFNNLWSIKFNTGLAFRSPNSSELYGYASNIYLEPEVSRGQEIGIQKVSDKDLFKLVFFKNKISNLINYDFEENLLKNINHSKNKGYEVRYFWERNVFNGSLVFRLQDPRDNLGLRLLRRSKKSLSINVYRNLLHGTINLNFIAFDKKRDFGDITLPKYHLINLTFLKKISKKMELTIKLENLLDEEYFTASGFNGYYQNQGRAMWLNVTYKIEP